jgi:hypothetical protein
MQTIKINGENWDYSYSKVIHIEWICSFECYFIPYWRTGFAHYVRMYKAEKLVCDCVSEYYNRTRESRDFQTAILSCLDKYEKKQIKQAKSLTRRLTTLFENHEF